MRAASIAAALLGASRGAWAQDARDDTAACLRFTFGAWTPALDWRTAGHHGPPDSTRIATTPEGRAWAAPIAAREGSDTLLLLFPAFWPAGVSVRFDPRELTAHDTVAARATALVADARLASPISRARVWRVPCR